MLGDFDRPTDVRGWQATVVTLGPMVWAFGRLHLHSPSAGSTSDLVAKVLGERTRLVTGLLRPASDDAGGRAGRVSADATDI